MAITTSMVMLGLAAASTAAQTYKAFTDKGPAAPKLPTAPDMAKETVQANQGATAAGNRQRKRANDTYSRSDTILTGPAGITTPAPAQRKTLLGA